VTRPVTNTSAFADTGAESRIAIAAATFLTIAPFLPHVLVDKGQTRGTGFRFRGIKSNPGPRIRLGNAAAANLRLIVRCKECRHQVEPDPAEMAERYGAETTVPDWAARLVYSRCKSRNIDMVVSGARRG